MLETSKVYFKRTNYFTYDDMMFDINKLLSSLLAKNYACSMYKSLINDNVYVIEFSSVDPELNNTFMHPFFITPEEATVIAQMRKVKKDDAVDVEVDDDFGGNLGGHQA